MKTKRAFRDHDITEGREINIGLGRCLYKLSVSQHPYKTKPNSSSHPDKIGMFYRWKNKRKG